MLHGSTYIKHPKWVNHTKQKAYWEMLTAWRSKQGVLPFEYKVLFWGDENIF